jgi:mono/diheme cytochrome c family protein
VHILSRLRRWLVVGGVCGALLGGAMFLGLGPKEASASGPWLGWRHRHADDCCGEPAALEDVGGTWYWLRSPDEEKRVTAGLYNRYCIRCHGVDGRGVWDIPGVPDFANPRWQATRSDAQRARIILEGRGAVMPPFRGALSLEEAWALGRYLHTFVPGTEVSRPDTGRPANPGGEAPKKPEPAPR